MKNKTKLSIFLSFGFILLAILGLNSSGQAQVGMQPVADTGAVILGPGESMTVTVVSKRGNNPIHLEFEWTGYAATDLLLPSVPKVFEGVTSADLIVDNGYSFDAPTTFNGATASSVRIEVSCDRPQRCVVAGQIFRTVVSGGVVRKEYVGHVTLIK